MKSLNEVFKESTTKYLESQGLGENPKEKMEQVKLLTEMMDPKYRANPLPFLDMREALQTGDMSILFPKAISDVLIKPREPIMIGQTLLSRTVQAPGVRSLELPMLGALRAFDVAEGQEYPEVQPSIGERFIEVRTNKTGLMLNISEDVLKDSMWDILGIMVEAAGFAMMRYKEQKIFNEAIANGHVVFDNTVDDPKYWTAGRGRDQKPNFSVAFDDFIDTMGAIVSHEYIPTDIVMHPMAWMVFAKDPVLRAQFLTQGQIGQTVWKNIPNFNQSANVPWNVGYQVTPFMPMANKELKKVNSGGTALESSTAYASTFTTDVMVLDRNSSVVVLQKEPMMMESYEDFTRECTKTKFREKYGIGVMNNGRSIALIKNVRLEQNYAPVLTVNNVTAA